MKINIDKMDTYKFVVCVLIFVLIFTLIFTVQMRSVINMQGKLLEQYLNSSKTDTPFKAVTPTPTTTLPTNKYQNY